jgi:4-amino-4-deoxychorismate lyase
LTLIDGQPESGVPVDDRGLLYGDGLFETLRVRDGQVRLWPWHWRRFTAGCAVLDLQLPGEDRVRDEIREVAGAGDQMVRLTLTRGSGRGYAAPSQARERRIVSALGAAPAAGQKPLEIIVCQTPLAECGRLAGVKHLSRLEQVLAANEVKRSGADEGLMLGSDKQVIEATQSNLFGVREGRLFTPDLSTCGVAGVYRQHLLDRVGATIGAITTEALTEFDEVFLCNSVRGIMPVTRIRELGQYATEFGRELMNEVLTP